MEFRNRLFGRNRAEKSQRPESAIGVGSIKTLIAKKEPQKESPLRKEREEMLGDRKKSRNVRSIVGKCRQVGDCVWRKPSANHFYRSSKCFH